MAAAAAPIPALYLVRQPRQGGFPPTQPLLQSSGLRPSPLFHVVVLVCMRTGLTWLFCLRRFAVRSGGAAARARPSAHCRCIGGQRRSRYSKCKRLANQSSHPVLLKIGIQGFDATITVPRERLFLSGSR